MTPFFKPMDIQKPRHEFFMQQALKEAQKAFDAGEIPIGAVLVEDGKIIARAYNTRQKTRNPLHHAEMIVLTKAGKKKKDWRLTNTTLYVTLEPCPMCLGALLQARVGTLVFGCADPKRQSDTGENPPVSPFCKGGQIELPSLFPPLQKGDTGGFFPSLKGIKSIHGNNHTLQIIGSILEKECAMILQEFFKQKRKTSHFKLKKTV
ncbi:MAG: hypothetical protein A2048_04435 [Deltaproteobacteria bacterium GWA2_45_12]|nr:MAG: hypothetical protein A2048_04435 [Deltaproteobacteria bacterium GWA2_45_12]